jgi:hypothetical protein
MRQFISVDTVTIVPLNSAAQCLAISQTFPLTKSKRRFLFASGEVQDNDGLGQQFSINHNTGGGWWTPAPFIAVAFAAADGTFLDTVYIHTIPPTQTNILTWAKDSAQAGFKWGGALADFEFFYSGRGGYPAGTVAIALMAGLTVYNIDVANPHNCLVRLRAIMEELPEEAGK